MKTIPDPSPTRAAALKIAAVYAVAGALWILCSGWLLHHFVHNEFWESTMENIKGWFYVLVTAILLGWWLDRYFRMIRNATGKLHQSETRFESIFKHSPEAIGISRLGDGVFVDVNEAFVRLSGWERAEIIGRTSEELEMWHSENRPRLVEELRANGFAASEMQARRKNGEILGLRISLRLVDLDGQACLLGVLSDITERKRAEEIARQSQRRLDFALQASQTGAWSINLQDRTATRTRIQAQIFGYPDAEGEWNLEKFLDHVLAEDLDRVRQAIRIGIDTRTGWSFECRIRRPDDQVRWVFISGGFEQDGPVPHVSGIVQDITERKQAEAALRESEERFRTLFEQAGVGVAEMESATGRFIHVNQRYCDITGYSDEEMLHLDFQTLTHPDDLASDLAQMDQLRAGTIRGFAMEKRYQRKDGAIVWVALTVSPLWPAGHEPTRHVAVVQDITARKRAEEERSAMAAQRQLALSAARLGWWHYDPVTRISTWDDRYKEIFEVAGHESPNEAILARLDQDDLPKVWASVEAALAPVDPQPYSAQYRIHLPNGSTRWVEAHGLAEFTGEGPGRHAISLVGTVEDITERKKAEEALRERMELQDQLAKIVATAPGVIFSFRLHPDGRMAVPFCTPGMEEKWGMRAEDLREDFAPAFTRIHADDAERVRRSIAESARTMQPWRDNFRINHPRHGEIWLEGHSVPRQEPDGGILWHGFVQDVTDRIRAEQSVRDSELRRALALDAAKAGTWEWDLSTGRNIWSDELWTLYGLDPRSCEASYETWRQTVHPEDRLRLERSLQESVRQEAEISMEWRVNLAAGGERWLMSRGRPLRDEAGQATGYLGVVIDISERKRLEQERAAMEATMRQQQKLESIGTLASGVAHEINNPITGIMNYAQLIQDRLPEDSPLVEFTDDILHETERVATIVSNLLTFARNEKQSHSPAHVADILEAVLSLVRAVIRRDQITLKVGLPEGLPQMKCRSQQIQQVIMNLVTNARDALNERFPGHDPDKVLNLEASLFEKGGRRWIRITVEDHGAGITPEVRERMFDPFFTTKGRNEGTGLGLSISHGIVKEHHGEWTVETEPGRFTRMHVDLPVDNGWEI